MRTNGVGFICAGLLAASVSYVSSASAIGLQFMGNSAERYFTQEDWSLAVAAADKAVQSTGQSAVKWRNPKNKHHGDMSARSIGTLDGRPCKSLSMVSTAGGRTDGANYILCKQADDMWKIPSSGAEIIEN